MPETITNPVEKVIIEVDKNKLGSLYQSLFEGCGLNQTVKNCWIEHLLEADLTGHDSHGLQQIIGYRKSLASGRINPTPTIKEMKTFGGTCHLDADAAPGQFAGVQAIKKAIELSEAHGISMVSIRNSNHFGMAGYFTGLAARQGFVSFATSDTNVSDLVPFGGISPVVGNNPISWGFPTGDEIPVIYDGACGTVSGGKIKHFSYLSKSIPPDWGIDQGGRMTDDPVDVIANYASYKGTGLATICDLLCGPLMGMGASFFKDKQIHNSSNGIGHLFICIHPEVITSKEKVYGEVRALKKVFNEHSTPANPVYFPGEKEHVTRQRRLKSGIPVPVKLLEHIESELGIHF